MNDRDEMIAWVESRVEKLQGIRSDEVVLGLPRNMLMKRFLEIACLLRGHRPVRPVAFGTTEGNGVIRTLFKCPVCYVMTERYQRFCWNCGRGLNWDG